jgi:YVTN family beta-propeller protein
MSGYSLGIDIGTTYTAAAVSRRGTSEMVSLTTHGVVIPTVAWMDDDGSFVVGAAAERRAMSAPSGLAREFKRRFGDSSPLVLSSSPVSVERVTAEVVRWVVDHVTEQEGSGPDHVALTHPAPWGEYKLDLMRESAVTAGIENPLLVSEPVAASIDYGHERIVPEGELIAVYDFGGGTFDATVVRSTGSGFEIVGDPSGIERMGGMDLDAAVLAHVQRTLHLDQLSDTPDDAASIRLRDECREAKEALSEASETTISVIGRGDEQHVRLTRSEFEDMARDPIRQTLSHLDRVIASAGQAPEGLAAVLLVGGSSRIPLVAEMVSAELGRPVAIDSHPKHAVSLGAARLAGDRQIDGATGLVPIVTAGAAAATATGTAGATDESEAVSAPESTPETPTLEETSTTEESSTSKESPADATPAATKKPPAATKKPPADGDKKVARLGLVLGGIAAVIIIIGAAILFWPSSSDSGELASFACCPFEVAGFPAGAAPTDTGLTLDLASVTLRTLSDGSVWSFDPTERTALEQVSIGGEPVDIETVAANGALEVWVADVAENRVVFLDSSSLEPVGSTPVGADPQSLAVAPDGSVWVANYGDDSISVISPDSHEVTATIDAPGAPISVHSSAELMWVAAFEADRVLVFDPATQAQVADLEVGAGPLVAQPVGAHVLVPNSRDGTVSIIDALDLETPATTVDTGGAISVSDTQIAGLSLVLTGTDKGIAVLDAVAGEVREHVEAGSQPVGSARTVSDAGDFVWITDFSGQLLRAPLAELASVIEPLAEGENAAAAIGWDVVPLQSPRIVQQVPGGVMVELFPGSAVAIVDEVTLEVTLILPGNAEPPPGLIPQSTDPAAPGQTTSSTPGTPTTTTTTPLINPVTVPNVVGQSADAAAAQLLSDGFESIVTQGISFRVAAGLVSSQTPAAFTVVEGGSPVTIRVSTGSGAITLPPDAGNAEIGP